MNNLTNFLYSKIDKSYCCIKNVQTSLDIIENNLREAKLYHSKNMEFIDKIENLKEKINNIERLIEEYK